MLIVETADMLQAPLFTAEALLRAHGGRKPGRKIWYSRRYSNSSNKVCVSFFFFLDWDREKLLEAWMLDADGCCQRSGVAMPTPPPCGYNAWDTLPSPRTPKTPRSPLTLTLTSPTDSCLTPGEEGLSTVRRRSWGRLLLSDLLFFPQPQIIPFVAVFIRYYS